MAVQPYYKKKFKQKNKKIHRALSIICVFIFIISGLTICVAYNIGPMNELSCMYFNVENPTYADMVKFVINDVTNYNEYTTEYKCGHFANDVIANARAQGMQAGFVSMESEPANHAIVVFKTQDQGIYFLEPQSDVIFSESEMEHFMDIGNYRIRETGESFDMLLKNYRIYWWFGLI